MKIVDREGMSRELVGQVGKPLMHQLRPLKIGIVGFCNGNVV